MDAKGDNNSQKAKVKRKSSVRVSSDPKFGKGAGGSRSGQDRSDDQDNNGQKGKKVSTEAFHSCDSNVILGFFRKSFELNECFDARVSICITILQFSSLPRIGFS